jgi:hypothetical protein
MKYGNCLLLVVVTATLALPSLVFPAQPPARRPAVGEEVAWIQGKTGVVPTCRVIVVRPAPAPAPIVVQPSPQIFQAPAAPVGPDPAIVAMLQNILANQKLIIDRLHALQVTPPAPGCPPGPPIIIDGGGGIDPNTPPVIPGGSAPPIVLPPGSAPPITLPGGSAPPITLPKGSAPPITLPGGSAPPIMPPAASLPPTGYQQYAVWHPRLTRYVRVYVPVVYLRPITKR